MADEKDLSFTVERRGRLHIMSFRGGSLDPDTIEWLHGRIRERTGQVPELQLVLDLQKVTHVPSRFLGVLVDINSSLARSGGQLRICGLEPMTLQVFRIMHLDRILKLSASREQAIREMAGE